MSAANRAANPLSTTALFMQEMQVAIVSEFSASDNL